MSFARLVDFECGAFGYEFADGFFGAGLLFLGVIYQGRNGYSVGPEVIEELGQCVLGEFLLEVGKIFELQCLGIDLGQEWLKSRPMPALFAGYSYTIRRAS